MPKKAKNLPHHLHITDNYVLITFPFSLAPSQMMFVHTESSATFTYTGQAALQDFIEGCVEDEGLDLPEFPCDYLQFTVQFPKGVIVSQNSGLWRYRSHACAVRFVRQKRCYEQCVEQF